MSNETVNPQDAWAFETKQIHAGQTPDAATGARALPIYQTTSFVFEDAAQAAGRFSLAEAGPIYTRITNPTQEAVETRIAALEGGVGGLLVASGQAAETLTILNIAEAGDHVVASPDLYGGTFNLLQNTLSRYGITTTFVENPDDPESWRAAARPNTKLFFGETIANPKSSVLDIAGVAAVAHELGVPLVVDNTIATPYLLRPLEHGADIVLHSATKYLNGHSDSVGGVVVLNDEKDAEWLAFIQNSAGAILSPFDSWLVLRGTKTLAVRMEQHDATGRRVAAFLEEHPKVLKLYYPGSLSHKQHDLAKRQQRGFGGMVAFETGSLENARTVLESVRLCTLAESLGGVETLISHPATMTHASVLPETRARLGITDGLVRVSVGLEDAEDIIADLDQALSKIP